MHNKRDDGSFTQIMGDSRSLTACGRACTPRWYCYLVLKEVMCSWPETTLGANMWSIRHGVFVHAHALIAVLPPCAPSHRSSRARRILKVARRLYPFAIVLGSRELLGGPEIFRS